MLMLGRMQGRKLSLLRKVEDCWLGRNVNNRKYIDLLFLPRRWWSQRTH
jgi:hypothetical protein